MVDISTITVDAFEACRHQAFATRTPHGEVAMTLAEVNRLGHGYRDGDAFSLLFVAPSGPFLPQAIYPMAHPTLGALEIFLVPLGPRDGGNAYEAVFT
jgi:hypothetical protein